MNKNKKTNKGADVENLSCEKISKITKLYKVLGDENRFKIVYSLMQGRKCVHELTEILNVSQSLVSHQLRVLRMSNIVKTERIKNHIYYSLDDEHIESLINIAKCHIEEKE